MNTKRLAQDYLRRAKMRRQALQVLFEQGDWSDVVREAQEITELALKGILRFMGIEPPKKHDVSHVLLRHKDRLPERWQSMVEDIRAVSKELVERRSEAFYGDEATLTPASELFDEEDARRAIVLVDELLELFDDLLRGAA